MQIRTLQINKRTSTIVFTKVCIFIYHRTTRGAKHRELEKWRFFERAMCYCYTTYYLDAISSRWPTADQLVFFVLPWLFVLPWQLWGTVLTGLTPTNNIISNFWFGFWLENKSSFRSFYALMYCSKKRVYIVRKTKVRNHRRVASSQSAKFQFLLKWWVLQIQPLWGRAR